MSDTVRLESGLRIGRLAERAGVGVETVRFYERRGLLKEPPRTPSGYRVYDEESLQRLRFIRRAKALGFGLGEVGELVSLRLDSDTTCADVRARVEAKVADLENRIRELERMKRALANLAAACEEPRPARECPLLEALLAAEGEG